MVERLEEEYLLDNSSFKSDHLRIDTDKLKPAKHNLLSEHRLANQKSSNRCLNILFVNRITQQL